MTGQAYRHEHDTRWQRPSTQVDLWRKSSHRLSSFEHWATVGTESSRLIGSETVNPDAPAFPQIVASNSAREIADSRWAHGIPPLVHRQVSHGHIVSTPSQEMPYMVVLHYREGDNTEHPFDTMRHGEAFIRSQAPLVQTLASLRAFEGCHSS